MPSLMRFLTVVGVLLGLGFACFYGLANFVSPRSREMVVTIPAQRLKPQSAEAVARNPKTAGTETAGTDAAAVESPTTR